MSCGNRPGTNRKRRPQKQPERASTERTQSYGRAIRDACARAFPYPPGLDDDAKRGWRERYYWAPNRLRHAYATTVRRGFGLDAAQAALGHARADVTQVYAELDLHRVTEVAAKIG